jgi:hypothetical protein
MRDGMPRLSLEDVLCLSFEGGSGYVTVTVTAGDGKTKIDLVTQEWDFQVREFAASL